jgi:hypothetical protein
MALTRPRAAQIFNLDYKQSTRVVATDTVNLAGGAPNQVDGVNLSLNDRILVTAQNTGSQNGLYLVDTVGSGANGTWIRTSDGNENGEIEAGMIVMVAEGAIYADTQWKLITDDPITIGTTALTFTQNYMANSISSGTSNVVVNSNANVTISSAGTANVLLISSTGTVTTGTASVTGNITGGNLLTGGLISATGNITGNYFLGNVFYANGITASKIYNGTSEANVGTSGGNANISIGGTSNVVVFASTGEYVTGLLSVTGNITGGNILTSGSLSVGLVTSNLVPATSNVYSLGSSTNRWANLWLTGNTIYLGNAVITSAPSGDVIIDSSGSFAVPVGTTAERSEITGSIRYNTTVGAFETYNGSGWNTLAYGTQTDFPFGDYGSVSDAATSDAFGVSIAATFDCNAEGPFSYTDLANGEAYVGA